MKKQMNIRLEVETIERLKEFSKETGLSITEICEVGCHLTMAELQHNRKAKVRIIEYLNALIRVTEIK